MWQFNHGCSHFQTHVTDAESTFVGWRASIPRWLLAGSSSQFLAMGPPQCATLLQQSQLSKRNSSLPWYVKRISFLTMPWRESVSNTKVTTLCSLVKDITVHHLCHILFVRIEASHWTSPHSWGECQEAEITGSHLICATHINNLIAKPGVHSYKSSNDKPEKKYFSLESTDTFCGIWRLSCSTRLQSRSSWHSTINGPPRRPKQLSLCGALCFDVYFPQTMTVFMFIYS